VLDEVDDDESDDFADFDDFDEEEDAPDVTEEQRALVALFETARCDRAGQQLMAMELQAQREVRDIAHAPPG
jgi:hypothetical protein